MIGMVGGEGSRLTHARARHARVCWRLPHSLIERYWCDCFWGVP